MLHKNSDLATVTVQTRPTIEVNEDRILCEFADVMGRAERSLFAETGRGRSTNECKSSFLTRFGITARHFNAIRVQLIARQLS